MLLWAILETGENLAAQHEFILLISLEFSSFFCFFFCPMRTLNYALEFDFTIQISAKKKKNWSEYICTWIPNFTHELKILEVTLRCVPKSLHRLTGHFGKIRNEMTIASGVFARDSKKRLYNKYNKKESIIIIRQCPYIWHTCILRKLLPECSSAFSDTISRSYKHTYNISRELSSRDQWCLMFAWSKQE